jgi:hypothetical protein
LIPNSNPGIDWANLDRLLIVSSSISSPMLRLTRDCFLIRFLLSIIDIRHLAASISIIERASCNPYAGHIGCITAGILRDRS